MAAAPVHWVCIAQGEALIRIAAQLWNLFDADSTDWCFACCHICTRDLWQKVSAYCICGSLPCRGNEMRNGEITVSAQQRSLLQLAAEVLLNSQQASHIPAAEEGLPGDDLSRTAKRRKVCIGSVRSIAMHCSVTEIQQGIKR